MLTIIEFTDIPGDGQPCRVNRDVPPAANSDRSLAIVTLTDGGCVDYSQIQTQNRIHCISKLFSSVPSCNQAVSSKWSTRQFG
jgi:hypothetical protein